MSKKQATLASFWANGCSTVIKGPPPDPINAPHRHTQSGDTASDKTSKENEVPSSSSSSPLVEHSSTLIAKKTSTIEAKKKRRVIDDSDSDIQDANDASPTAHASTTEKAKSDDESRPPAKRSLPSPDKKARAKKAKKSSSPTKSSYKSKTEVVPPHHAPSSGSDSDLGEHTAEPPRASPLNADLSKPEPVSTSCSELFTNVCWKQGEKVPYVALCDTFDAVEATTKRLEIQSILTKYLLTVIRQSPDDLLQCVYLCINRLSPEYEGKELGIGESILIKAIAVATGRPVAKIKADLETVGDLGKVAQSSRSSQQTMFKPKPLTVSHVFNTLKEISEISGGNSQAKKIAKMNSMLVACNGPETKYLVRSLEGKLRIGLAEQTVLVSLANAAVRHEVGDKNISKESMDAACLEATGIIKQVYSELPNYDVIIPTLLMHGYQELPNRCQLTPGIPLKPMLAHPTKALSDVLDRFEGMTFTCEYKYDGERAQIHKLEDGSTRIFSRNSENLSGKYPDIMDRLPNIGKPGTVTSFVLDAEAVPWDREKKCILPFQVLSTRKRKGVTTEGVQVQVLVFAFDLLYLNGQPLIREPFVKRREILHQHFQEIEGEFAFAKHMDTADVGEIQTFLDESVVGNCEGLMVKTLEKEASYEPSKRSRNWLKVKKDYLSGVGDTLDLVVIGGYVGKGKRTGAYGGYLLACYDEDNEIYQSICKIGTGFSDEDLARHYEFFSKHKMDRPKHYYAYSDNPKDLPDVWFEPVQVWEIKAADLSISPVHKAASGLVDSNKGISLRFPRFIRTRDDKNPEQATNAAQIADLYRAQNINSNNKGTLQNVDEFE
ncbi:hypothetical protein SeMB42_g05004 [Synchytrium endobioticum]|uniref:DNA ligase n=1 Tax=Synchytrium endobioticum TaxID=286115 RepID=A0A507CTI1_9FUNG|nr:hypothetical protein SeLEV6574_g05589 [Synchytrium endobioticum]TPX42744.1 hypothetical protein SeMB42_g05004 [Synchytrium endobioticum]